MRRRSLRFFVLLAVSLSVACSEEMKEPVHLTAQAAPTADGRVVVTGVTNLPDQTVILTSVSNEEIGFGAQDESIVSNGTFSAGPLGPESGLVPGNYVISTTMPVPMTQPESVQLVTGKNGEHLTGPLVKESSWGTGRAVNYSFEYVVGSEQTIAQLKDENREDVDELRSALSTLLEKGRTMERYRRLNDMSSIATCREMMIENGRQAELVRAKADALKTKTTFEEFVALGASSTEMAMCVTCADNALEHCDRAADYLQNGL